MIAANGLGGDGGSEFLGDRDSTFPIDMRQDDGKFLAAEAAEKIAGAQGRLAGRCDRLEDLVSCGMSVRNRSPS